MNQGLRQVFGLFFDPHFFKVIVLGTILDLQITV